VALGFGAIFGILTAVFIRIFINVHAKSEDSPDGVPGTNAINH